MGEREKDKVTKGERERGGKEREKEREKERGGE